MAVELAIFEDCGTLVENFVAAGELSYASFCQQWKAMKFQHIFSAQTSNIELRQTTNAIFHYTKRTVCGRNTRGELLLCNTTEHTKAENVLRRSGAMFLMYSIYSEQPNEPPVKIEVSQDTWNEFNEFVNSLTSSSGTDDVQYTFWQLYQDKAFNFTALDYCMGLENLVDYDKLENETSGASATLLPDGVSQQLRQELHEFTTTQRVLPALTVLESGYNEMKEMLLQSGNQTGLNKHSLPPTTIFSSLQESFKNISAILDEKPTHETKNVKENESKKRSLKRKGYKQADKPAASSAETENDDDTEMAESESEQEDGIDAYGKKQWAIKRESARTVFTKPLPKKLLMELKENSENEEAVDEANEVEKITEEENEDELIKQELEQILNFSVSGDNSSCN